MEEGGPWPLEDDNFIAALRCDRINTSFVFDQPINAVSFTAWIEEQLCPTLGPGDIVDVDNLSSHKKPAVRAAIRAEARISCPCRPTVPISIRSNSSSPSLSICWAKPQSAPSKPHGGASARCSMPSRPTNAPTTSETSAMHRGNVIRL